jgi:molybdate transport repressor ModE-like protein
MVAMLDPVKLRTLAQVARVGSVSGAARALGFTPQAVSQQLARLEEEVGAQLLQKHGRGVVLTDAAIVLVATASRIESATEQALADLAQLSTQIAGTLTVDAFPTGVRGLLAPAMPLMRETAPGVTVILREKADEPPLLEALLSYSCDLAVMHRWDDQPQDFPAGLVAEALGTDRVDVVLPAAHPLAARPEVDIADLADAPWIMEDEALTCAHFLTTALARVGAAPRVAATVTEYESQLALAAHGVGLAVIPRLSRGPLPAGLVARPIQATSPCRNLYAVHRASSTRLPAIRVMIDQLHLVAARIDLGPGSRDLAARPTAPPAAR